MSESANANPIVLDTSSEPRVPLVSAENVSVAYGGSYVLRDINLNIPRGETLAIIGESGCGKTVLMKTLIGLVSPQPGGTICYAQRNVAEMTPVEKVEFRRKIGFVFQNAALFDSMTIGQNIAFPLRQNGEIDDAVIRELVIDSLADVGLPDDVVGKRPAQLSGGMRKRVGIARALILKPELVLYDEPTTGLDPIVSDVINELMLGIRRKYPVTSAIVTHDMKSARKVADRVIMLFPRRRLGDDEPQMIFDGPPTALDNADDRRVRQFVRGEAGERLMEMRERANV